MKKITRSINVTTVKAVFANIEDMTIVEKNVVVVGECEKEIKKELESQGELDGLKFVAEKARQTENRLYEMTEEDFVLHGSYVGDGRLANK